MSFICPFKNVVVTLTPERWLDMVILDCDVVDFEDCDTYSNYNKFDFVNNVNKTGFGILE